MIYLDCAATSLQKPAAVAEASSRAMRTLASPGRGGHAPAMLAAKTAFECRSELAEMFGAGEPERVVFTMNATHGLNIAANALVRPGDRVVTSGWEHNSVMRALKLKNADTVVADSHLFDTAGTLEAFRRAIPGASAVFCTHVSNVFGFVLPIEEIAVLCRREGVPLVVDASQSAGTLPLDFEALGAEFIAMPGHKGLLGPQGTGVLLCRRPGTPLMAGGTGSNSRSADMPDILPDCYEAGTHNITGIAGLLEGARYVRRRGLSAIREHETALARQMIRELGANDAIELFASDDERTQTGVLSLRARGMGCEELGAVLGERGVAVRAGLHCAPLAHSSAGTLDTGTVRLSFSPFNTALEVTRAAREIKKAVAEERER